MRLTLHWIGFVACALLSSCGGSGGTVLGGSDALQGNYFYAALGGSRTAVPAFSRIQAGEFTADGAGGASATSTLVNEDGVLGAPGVHPLTYTIGAGGALTLSDAGQPVMTGSLTADGEVALGADLTASNDPNMVLIVKSVGAFGNASLSGGYHLLGVSVRPSGVQTTVIQGVSFNGTGGMGNLPLPGYSNQSGAVTPGAAFATTGTYAVAANGRVTVDGGLAMGRYTGTVVAGGSFAVLAGDTVAGSPPRLLLLVKVGTGVTNAAFSGTYAGCGVSFDDATRQLWTCGKGDFTVDGAGSITSLTSTGNTEGVISTDTGTDDYGVAANGTLLVGAVSGPGPFKRGAISADGRFAVVSGSIVAGQPPMLYVLVRK